MPILRQLYRLLINLLFLILIGLAPIPVKAQETNQTTLLPLITRNFDARWQWSLSETFDMNPRPRNEPISVIDSRGRLHVFWDTLYTPRFIYHCYLTKKGWSEPRPIAASLGSSTLVYAPLPLDDGSLHTLWLTDMGYDTEPQYRFLYATFDGIRWTEPETVFTTHRSWYKGMVQTDSNDDIRITVADTLFLSSIIQIRHTDDGWARSDAPDVDHSTSLIWPDRYGGLHYYGRNPNGGLYYSYWRDDVMLRTKVAVGGPDRLAETQLDSNSNLHVFEKGQVPVPGGTVYGVYYQCMTNELEWHGQQVVSGHQAIIGSPIAATDRSGLFILAWKVPGNGVGITLREDCNLNRETLLSIGESVVLRSIAVQNDPGKICVLYSENTYSYRAACTSL